LSLGFGSGGLGEILRRHFPRSERVIRQLIQAVSFQTIARVSINDFDLRNIPILLKSKIRLVEDITSKKVSVSGGVPEYLPSLEPDYTSVVMYLHLDHVANIYTDYSGFNNHAELLAGDGVITTDEDGPDLGNGYKSEAPKLTGVNTDKQRVMIPNPTQLRLANLPNGFSLHIRFRPSTLLADAGENRTLWGNADDANNAVRLVVDPSGAVIIHVKKAGATYKVKSANVVSVASQLFYDAVITYNTTGNVITIYMAAGTYTTADGTTMNFNTTDFDCILYGWGELTTVRGYWAGNIQHFVFWNRVLSAAEAANLLANKWTTNNTSGKKVALTFFSIAGTP
jgi:Concanavalin A-like lectin/glucanases superfamily